MGKGHLGGPLHLATLSATLQGLPSSMLPPIQGSTNALHPKDAVCLVLTHFMRINRHAVCSMAHPGEKAQVRANLRQTGYCDGGHAGRARQ